jgi:DNA ligase-1
MLLGKLVDTSAAVARTRARSAKIAALAELLAGMDGDEVRLGVSYLTGELPQGKIGVGYAAAFSLDVTPAAEGTLSLRELDARLEELKSQRGSGANGRRAEQLGALFAKATLDEQDFLKRLLVGELRQGALEGVMTDAIARAFGVPVELVRRSAMLEGNLARVAESARSGGKTALGGFKLEVLKPVGPMLAQSASNTADALAELGPAIFEHKLDGARVQVHKLEDSVRVFTRSLHDVSSRVPEIVEATAALPARSLILDGEALSLTSEGRPQPFQISMRRFGKKTDDERLRAELPFSAFYFDVLHLDGEDLIDRPALARRDALSALLPERSRVPSIVTAEPEEAAAFLAGALSAGHEGVMAKSQTAPYEMGRRGAGWLKVKRTHTLDLVVLAVEWGSGRRKGLLSNIHLGARDPKDESFVMLGKTFKGMTDEMLAWQTEQFLRLKIGREGHIVHVRPELVVEIAFDGVQVSTQYPGGVALRFARVKRYRPDKKASDADTIDTVQALVEPAQPNLAEPIAPSDEQG